MASHVGIGGEPPVTGVAWEGFRAKALESSHEDSVTNPLTFLACVGSDMLWKVAEKDKQSSDDIQKLVSASVHWACQISWDSMDSHVSVWAFCDELVEGWTVY